MPSCPRRVAATWVSKRFRRADGEVPVQEPEVVVRPVHHDLHRRILQDRAEELIQGSRVKGSRRKVTGPAVSCTRERRSSYRWNPAASQIQRHARRSPTTRAGLVQFPSRYRCTESPFHPARSAPAPVTEPRGRAPGAASRADRSPSTANPPKVPRNAPSEGGAGDNGGVTVRGPLPPRLAPARPRTVSGGAGTPTSDPAPPLRPPPPCSARRSSAPWAPPPPQTRWSTPSWTGMDVARINMSHGTRETASAPPSVRVREAAAPGPGRWPSWWTCRARRSGWGSSWSR
jgi:hypothetical protein